MKEKTNVYLLWHFGEKMIFAKVAQSTEVRFASFLSGGFITAKETGKTQL